MVAPGLAITIAGGVLTGLVTAGTAVRRITGVLLAGVVLLIPVVMRLEGLPPASYRVTLTIASIVALRAMDLVSERAWRSVGMRILHIFMPFDTRLAKRCRPHLDTKQALITAAWAAAGYAAFSVAASSPNSSLVAHYIVRWLGALVWVMALFETLSGLISLSLKIVGFRIPLLHDAPYKSSSLREFWSARWNRLIGRWLREHCYRPLARRGRPRLGMIAAFVASAAIHFYVTAVLLNAQWGLVMAALFLLQIPMLWAEDRLQIRQRPMLLARAWTLGVVTVLSPLFTEPILRIFGT